jgi:hypothetical protein
MLALYAALLLSAAAAPDGSSALASPAKPEKLSVALLTLESNQAAAESAKGVGSLLASRLAGAPELKLITAADIATSIGLQRQKEILGEKEGGCTDTGCMAEISGAIGARYVVSGRLDKFGPRFVLTTSVYDAQRTVAIAKPIAQADSEESLLAAAGTVGDEMLAALGVQPQAVKTGPEDRGVVLAFKAGNQFIANFLAFSPGGELEIGWRFDPEWVAFLQIGISYARQANDPNASAGLAVVPSVLGGRKLYRVDKSFQPFWGLGLGLQLAFGTLGPIRQADSFPVVRGMFGFQYLFTQRFGGMIEGSTDVAQTLVGLSRQTAGAGKGLNFDLNLGVVYRF